MNPETETHWPSWTIARVHRGTDPCGFALFVGWLVAVPIGVEVAVTTRMNILSLN